MSEPAGSVPAPQATNLIGSLLERVRKADPALADDLRSAIKTVTADREFGLVFNRHLPETVELPGRAVRARDKVRIKEAADWRTWRVTRIRRVDGTRTAELVSLDAAGEPLAVPMSDVVVVADFRDPIYPGLKSTKRIERGGDKPTQVVINAENYHALEALTFAYTGKVDCIYIDPPYNTGGDLIYNDKRVSTEDGDRHAKWLSFIERRLRLAKRLLKPTGILIVAVDDNEQAHLKLLIDQVFGEQNFLANVVWQGSGKGDARYIAGGVDYMLIYARSEARLGETGIRWKERKPGIDYALDAAREAWEASGHDPAKAAKLYRGKLREMRGQLEPGVFRYNQIDDQGRVFHVDNLASPNLRANLKYEVRHPITDKPVRTPDKGWRYSREVMEELIAGGRIVFGQDETTLPQLKRLLAEQTDRVPYPTFTQDRRAASNRLKDMLGEKRFDFPKDTDVLARWISLVTGNSPDAVVLDFFAGSGSTAQAVMELNAADDGRRQGVLITNNELNEKAEKQLRKDGHRKGSAEWEKQGIYERVTRPRIETVVTGIRPDKSTYSEGMNENVEFFTLTYEDPEAVRLDLAFTAVAPMLWLRAGAQGSRIDCSTDTFAVADHYGVLFDPDHWRSFIAALAKVDELRCVYVVTDDDNVFQQVTKGLFAAVDTEQVDVVRLYENYLNNFEINCGRG